MGVMSYGREFGDEVGGYTQVILPLQLSSQIEIPSVIVHIGRALDGGMRSVVVRRSGQR